MKPWKDKLLTDLKDGKEVPYPSYLGSENKEANEFLIYLHRVGVIGYHIGPEGDYVVQYCQCCVDRWLQRKKERRWDWTNWDERRWKGGALTNN